jgi:hypothetical protein
MEKFRIRDGKNLTSSQIPHAFQRNYRTQTEMFICPLVIRSYLELYIFGGFESKTNMLTVLTFIQDLKYVTLIEKNESLLWAMSTIV